MSPLRPGRDGVMYRYVFFKTDKDLSIKTTICPSQGNYTRWEPFLEEGVVLENLELLNDTIINGDSWPRLVSRPEKQQELL